jgi:hypothetical protein
LRRRKSTRRLRGRRRDAHFSTSANLLRVNGTHSAARKKWPRRKVARLDLFSFKEVKVWSSCVPSSISLFKLKVLNLENIFFHQDHILETWSTIIDL